MPIANTPAQHQQGAAMEASNDSGFGSAFMGFLIAAMALAILALA